jgi:hypothetical protein
MLKVVRSVIVRQVTSDCRLVRMCRNRLKDGSSEAEGLIRG